MKMSGNAKVAGVAGWPVAHSLSPLMHNHWLDAHAIDGAYVPLAVRAQDFAFAVNGLKRAGFVGINVTVPHKQAAFAIAHDSDEASRTAGAVNLLLFGKDGRIEGRNTDASGLAASLAEEIGRDRLAARPAVLLGAGGAARAAILALAALGLSEIRVVNRTRGRAEILIRDLAPKVSPRLSVADWPQAASGAALLVNATAAGMQEGASALDLPLDALARDAAVCDIVYNPLETALLAAARARGHRTVNGLGMLMHQGAAAFAAFYGVTPKVTRELRGELEKALGP
jgi:shikimate dehydrogenase